MARTNTMHLELLRSWSLTFENRAETKACDDSLTATLLAEYNVAEATLHASCAAVLSAGIETVVLAIERYWASLTVFGATRQKLNAALTDEAKATVSFGRGRVEREWTFAACQSVIQRYENAVELASGRALARHRVNCSGCKYCVGAEHDKIMAKYGYHVTARVMPDKE